MDPIVEDIIRGVTNGIPGVDPEGKNVIIFLEPVCFLADYPAVTAMSDALGHTGNAFCNLCSMTKKERKRFQNVIYYLGSFQEDGVHQVQKAT